MKIIHIQVSMKYLKVSVKLKLLGEKRKPYYDL